MSTSYYVPLPQASVGSLINKCEVAVKKLNANTEDTCLNVGGHEVAHCVGTLPSMSRDLYNVCINKNGVVEEYNEGLLDSLYAERDFLQASHQAALMSIRSERRVRQNSKIRRMNADSPNGIEQTITTLALRSGEVVETLITEEDLSKVFTVDKTGGWHEEVVHPVIAPIGLDDISDARIQGANHQALKNVDVKFSQLRYPISTYAFNIPTNIIAQQQASVANFDLMSSLTKLALKSWYATRLKALMVGPAGGEFTGLLNNTKVATDSSLFVDYYKNLAPEKKQNILANLLSAYITNVSATATPNLFLVSKVDVSGQGGAFSNTFPTDYTNLRSLQLGLEEPQKVLDYVTDQAGSGPIKLVGSIAVDKSFNGQKTQYILCNNSRENVVISNPIETTINASMSYDGFHINTNFIERLAGFVVKRPETMYQFLVTQ